MTGIWVRACLYEAGPGLPGAMTGRRTDRLCTGAALVVAWARLVSAAGAARASAAPPTGLDGSQRDRPGPVPEGIASPNHEPSPSGRGGPRVGHRDVGR